MFPREPYLENRVIGPKHLRQHPLGKAGRQRPLVKIPSSFARFLAFLQCHGNSEGGLYEQMVLREKSGEQHAVPVLVGAFVHQTVDGLISGSCISSVAELAGVRA